MINFKYKIKSGITYYLIGIGFAVACGFYESGNNYGNSQFSPESIASKKYSPFFFSTDFYYGISHDEMHNSRFNEEICEDWSYYLEHKYSKKSIFSLLIESGKTQIDSISRGLTPRSLAQNTILKDRTNPKVKAFIDFLKDAKQCEKFAIGDPNSWAYYGDEKPKPKKSTSEICKKLNLKYLNSTDPFIKKRYWFQWVRACFFNEDYKGTISAFESEKESEKNTLYYRSLAYYAGAYYKQGLFAQSNYYYSLVFENCDELKPVAHYSFKVQSDNDWTSTLSLCKNDQEKITLWQMLGIFYADELRSINEISAIDPSSEKLDVLLTRAVNIAEGANLESAYKPDKQTKGFDKQINAFNNVLKLNPRYPYKWQMALGYLYALNNQPAESKKLLISAKSTMPNVSLLKAQYRQLNLIAEIQSINNLDEQIENRLLPELAWLRQISADSNFTHLRTGYTWSWILNKFSYIYRSQGEILKAECLVSNAEFYADMKNCEDMKKFLKNPDKNKFESFCSEVYRYSFEDICEYQGIKMIYQEDYSKAVEYFQSAGKEGLKELLSNPFNGGIVDCHDCDHAKPSKIKYTKLETAKRMKEMFSALRNDNYNNSILLANAFYNMTHYGSSRLFYQCTIINENQYNLNLLANEMYNMNLATKYYKMALESANGNEQRAKCTYMLAKCERNVWYNEFNNEIYSQGIDFKAWSSFYSLKKYSSTNFYREVIKECGYFKTFTLH
ncbi:MAG: hypothetical protein ACK452_03765 [Bacteroidota bacterium]|jgi:hypothetical protein